VQKQHRSWTEAEASRTKRRLAFFCQILSTEVMSAAVAISHLVSVPKRVWCKYLTILEAKPAQTKIATSVVAAFVGDMIAQRMSHHGEGKFRPDLHRTATLCAFNGGMGLFGHYYFAALDKGIQLGGSSSLASRASLAVQKTFVDQFICAPAATLMFYALKVVAERRPLEYASELKQKYVPTLQAGYQLWIPAHMVNFMFVPSQHRVLYTNVIAVAGTYVLSRAAAGEQAKVEEKPRSWRRRARKAEPETEETRLKPNEILFDCSVRID
jgi:protein Mpv17